MVERGDETTLGLVIEEPRFEARPLRMQLRVEAIPGETISEGSAEAAQARLSVQWIRSHLPSAKIAEINALASSVLGDQEKATRFLSEPNLATDNRPPIELIGEKDGFERVKYLLARIEYGVLA